MMKRKKRKIIIKKLKAMMSFCFAFQELFVCRFAGLSEAVFHSGQVLQGQQGL